MRGERAGGKKRAGWVVQMLSSGRDLTQPRVTHQRFGGQNAGTWLQLALHHWLVTRREIEMQFGISTSRAEAESKTAAKLVTRMIPGTERAECESKIICFFICTSTSIMRMIAVLTTCALSSAISARTYSQLTAPCKNAVAISGNLPCTSVADCEAQCDAQAAAAPGTGATPCVAVDTNGKSACYMKSHCDGTPGTCSGQCGYIVAQAPTAPPTPAPPIPPAPAGMTLRDAADRHGVFIGAATNVEGLTSTTDLLYKAVEQTHFSLTTAENACKVGPIHPAPGPNGYSWAGCDTIFAEAEKANQTVRGHNLCWHNENPTWLNATLTKDELVAALESHITAVIGHYGERAYAWDVGASRRACVVTVIYLCESFSL